MKEQEDPLSDYPVVVSLPVLWGEMDAFQHVNNVVYFRYFESARIAYGDKIGIYKHLKKDKIGPILASTSCNFLKPLTYPDTVQVGCRTVRLADSEMDQEYAIFSERLQKLAAVGTATLVAYDYGALKRATFPRPLIKRLRQLEEHLP